MATGVTAFFVALDPYDTGVFALFDGYGVPHFGPRLAGASLARRPEVEGAVIGNSTIQLVDPTRLTGLSGLRMVSLTMPGSGPLEQLTVARWLVRHHRDGEARPLKALVFGIDTGWCRGDGKLDLLNPFPFWLYSENRLDYVAHLVSLKTFEAALRKSKLILGIDRPLPPDGYQDYSEGSTWNQVVAERDFAAGSNGFGETGSHDFAAVPRLRDFLAELQREAAVVLVVLPRHRSSLPPPGSAAARQEEACKAAYRRIADARERTIVVDLLTDSPIVRDDRNFRDRVHFRKPVARLVEDAIAAAVGGMD